MDRQMQRADIISSYGRGNRVCDIVRELNFHRKTVQRVISRYEELGNLSDRARSGRPRTSVTRQKIGNIRDRIRRNPRRSMRKMAAELGISRESVRTIVKKKLNIKCYKRQKVHLLPANTAANRVTKCRRLLRRAVGNWHRSVLFTDEKVFTIDEKFNKQNSRIISRSLEDASDKGRHVFKSAHPSSVMVWAGITADGKTPLVFIEQGIRMTAEMYRTDVLEAVVQPWAHQHFGNRRWTFQQDSARPHTANITIA